MIKYWLKLAVMEEFFFDSSVGHLKKRHPGV